MKTFLIIMLVIGGLYLIAFYVWPWVFSLYLRCLSERNLEAYFIKLYRRFKDNPRKFRDNEVCKLQTIAQISCKVWNEAKEASQQELALEKDARLLEDIRQDIVYCSQKFEFWCGARDALKQEIQRREFFNSFRN